MNGNEKKDKAAESLLKRGAAKLQTADQPIPRSSDIFILDLRRDEQLLYDSMEQFQMLFEFAKLEPVLAGVCKEQGDIRNAILDGRVARRLKVGSMLRGPLYFSGPMHRFPYLGLKSLMTEREIRIWIGDRSSNVSLEDKNNSSRRRRRRKMCLMSARWYLCTVAEAMISSCCCFWS